jgi:hypothetical protein
VLWGAALAASLAVYRSYSPVLGGLLIGGAASLAAFRYRVWTLRRLAARPTRGVAFRLPLVGLGRYLILAAALALAARLSAAGGPGYLAAAAAGLMLCNVAIIVRALCEARHR